MNVGLIRKEINNQVKVATDPISVVVAARNEHSNLKKLIPALLSQEYPQFEIIIALDRCTDDSYKLLEEYPTVSNLRFIEIKELPQSFSGKKYALTQAIEHSNHEILVFTDADCVPSSKKWLQTVKSAYSDTTQIVIGYGPYRKRSGAVNLFVRYETILTAIQYFTFCKLGIPYMGVGRNMSYRKSFFNQNNGFDQFSGVTGGDDDLFISHHATRNNINSYYNKESHVFSEAKDNWKSLILQKQRHLSVGKYYRKKHQMILGLLGASQIMFWLTFAILAILKVNPPVLIGCFLIRYTFLTLFFIRGTKVLEEKFTWLWMPVLDIIHTLFLLIMGPLGFFTKRVKWS
ncbi:MAG: glycosyltransferase [Bacteroidota bacterium]